MSNLVKNCKKEKYDVYIGRGSKWGNPFKINKDGNRDEVIFKYRAWINSQPDLLKSLHELKNKTLGCYCAPKACHGEVLVELSKSKWIKNWFSNMLAMDDPIIENQKIKYWTVENFYQAMKIPKDRVDLRKKIADMSAHKAKTAIRDKKKFAWRKDWDREMALEVMDFALRRKFERGSRWYYLLKLSEGIPIIEYNNWGDKYWGVDLKSMEGENQLGKIIMRIRKNENTT